VYLGEDEDGRSRFIFRVIPNPDLVMELCKRGSRLEVLAPEALRQQVMEELRNALKMYE
jgi:predicted DNA-binding transcriptional regulator YafY